MRLSSDLQIFSGAREGDDRSGEWCSDPSHRTPQLLFLPPIFGYERGFFFLQLTPFTVEGRQ